MIEELKNILLGKSTSIKNKQYSTAKAYIEPFVNRLKRLNATFVCQAKMPEQVSITNGVPDLVYNKVHIQAILPKSYYDKEGLQKVVGMVYGLDLKTPVAKFYIANIDTDGNLITFDQDAITVQEIEPETALVYTSIDSLLSRTDNTEAMIKQIKGVEFDRDSLVKRLGEWIDRTMDIAFTNEGGKIQLANSLPINVYKAIIKDKDSEFYVSDTQKVNLYKLLQTFLSFLTKDDKDIVNRFEKTILVNKILQL